MVDPEPLAAALSVSELTERLRLQLEERFGWVQVRGEISNYKKAPSGHLYFRLKDEEAVLECVAWKTTAVRWGGLALEDGVEVIAGGKITIYPPRGQYQLVVTAVRPAGAGALQQRFELLKQRLAAEGLFDAERKRPLPACPWRIAVITSPTGAAVQDFLKIVRASDCPVEITVCPVLVQGTEAARDISEMIQKVNRLNRHDVIVVCRGGGSLEDLWAFNEEITARAIFQSAIPVISAVGHEIDFTIADFAADLRAPTPSGAAELLTPDREGLRAAVTNCRLRLRRVLAARIDREHQRLALARQGLHTMTHPLDKLLLRLDHLALGLEVALKRRLVAQQQRLDALVGRLAQRQPSHRLALQAQRVQELHYRLVQATQEGLREHARRFSRATGVLQAVSPLATLARGYAVVRRVGPDRAVVIDQAQVQAGERVEVLLHRGELVCRVEGKKQAEDSGAATPDQSRTASTS